MILGILFSAASNAELVAESVILGVLPSILVILALYSLFLTSPLVSGINFSASLIFFSKSDLSIIAFLFDLQVISFL